jgi:triosephosphate isomerase
MAKPLLAGNWKMHGTAQTAAKLAADLANRSGDSPDLIVFPPYVCIPAVVTELLAAKNIAIGAQNISHHSEGALHR